MTKRSQKKQTRRHVWLFDEDWEWIKSRYSGKIGPSEAVRMMVHTFVKRVQQHEQDAVDSAPGPKVERELDV